MPVDDSSHHLDLPIRLGYPALTRIAPTIRGSGMSPTAAEKNAQLREEITAGIERVRSQGKGEGSEELAVEVETLIGKLPARERSKLRDSLKEAAEYDPDGQQEPSTEVVTSSQDYAVDLPDAEQIKADASRLLSDGVQAQDKTVDRAGQVAEIMLSAFEGLRHRGAPDFMAKSYAARMLSSDIKDTVVKEYLAAHPEIERTYATEHGPANAAEYALDVAQAKVESLWETMRIRISDRRVMIANQMDDDPEELKRRFPQAVEAFPLDKYAPREALIGYYKFDPIGRSEKQRIQARKTRLRNKSKLGTITAAEQEELTQLEGRPQITAQQEEDPAKRVQRALSVLAEVTGTLSPETVRDLPDDVKSHIRETALAERKRLKTIIDATMED